MMVAVAGESAQPDTGRSSTGRNKPRDNNTDIEGPNVNIPSIDYAGSYEELKEKIELKEWFVPEVVEIIEIYSKTLDEEDFNDYLIYAFENNGMNEIELGNIEIPGIIGAALPFALAEPTPIGEGLVVIGVIGYTIYTSVIEPDTINFDKGLNNREKSRLKMEFDKTTPSPPK